MKGLLYRDIIINRKAWWCAVVLCLLSLKMLFDGSVNIEDDGTFVINLLVFLNIVVVYSFFDYVFSSGAENEARWKRFLCASPVTNKIIMLERYVVDYIFTLVGIISSSVPPYGGFIKITSNISFSFNSRTFLFNELS